MRIADVVRDTKTQILINKPENVQVEAARIVTGGTTLVSLNNLYCEVCYLSPIWGEGVDFYFVYLCVRKHNC